MAFSRQECQDLYQRLMEGDLTKVLELQPEEDWESYAFNFIISVASPELLRLLEKDIIRLIGSASDDQPRERLDYDITMANWHALDSKILHDSAEIKELFIQGIERRGIEHPEQNYRSYIPTFTGSFLRLVGFYNWIDGLES